MSPLAPYKSQGGGHADGGAFTVAAGTYVVHTDTGLASSEYSTSTPSPTATAGGTGMTLQVTVDGSNNVTAVQILNPGQDYKFHNTLRIPGDHFSSAGTGFVELALNPPSTTGLSANTPITASGGMFSGNPGGAQLSSVAALDVLTVANAKKMLTAVDGALVRVDLERSDLGATMSRMEHVINNLSNIVKNTQEARSRIQDADIALETTNLTKAQVLNQAAQAMLAQANRTSQSIMSLLQN
jgi:flagellin-like hook-associated protein FlgL